MKDTSWNSTMHVVCRIVNKQYSDSVRQEMKQGYAVGVTIQMLATQPMQGSSFTFLEEFDL